MGKSARSLLTLWILLALLGGQACTLTLKQDFLGIKREWLTVRTQMITLADQKKLTKAQIDEFILADKAFGLTYTRTVDKLLSGGDITEDEVIFLKDMITAWKAKVGL